MVELNAQKMEDFQGRYKFFLAILVLAFIVLVIRLWQLEVIRGPEFLRLSENNRIRLRETRAERGMLLDHTGEILAHNRPYFEVSLVPEDVKGSPEVLPLVLYLGFSLPLFSGGILAFLIGFLMDLFSGNVLGLYTLTRTLAFFVAQPFRQSFYWQGSSFQFLFVTLTSLLEGLLLLLLLVALTPASLKNLYPSVLTRLLPQALCTGLVTPLLFSFLRKGTEFLQEKEERHPPGRIEGWSN